MASKHIDHQPDRTADKRPRKLDPVILAAAQRANPGTVAAQKAALAAEHAATAAVEAGEAARIASGQIAKRTVIVNVASPGRAHLRKFTTERQREYLDLLAKAVTMPRAAEAVGVTPALIRKHMKEDPEFKDAVRAARSDATAPIVEALWDVALMGNFLAQRYLLENMDPENWRDSKKIDVAVSGQIDGPDSGQIDDRIGRIRRLEERLATRLALRAAGDQIEEEIAEAEVVETEAGQIDGLPPLKVALPTYHICGPECGHETEAGQIDDANDHEDDVRIDEDGEYDEPYGDRDFRRDVGF